MLPGVFQRFGPQQRQTGLPCHVALACSVYIPIFREEGRNPLLDAFDFANPSFTVGRRIRVFA